MHFKFESQLYEKLELVEIVDWPALPYNKRFDAVNPNEQIYRTDMFTALNECLMRNRYVSKYTVARASVACRVS
jgi:hypothetical protein